MHYFFIELKRRCHGKDQHAYHFVTNEFKYSMLAHMLAMSLKRIKRRYGDFLSAQVSPGGIGAANLYLYIQKIPRS